MSQLMSARLPEVTAERVKLYARKRQRSVNETISLALEEWLRQTEYAFIEFRDTREGRMAYMKNSRLPVYWVIKVAMSYEMDVTKVCEYWPNRPRPWVQAALNYYQAYTSEIDELIADYDAITPEIMKRQLPQIEIFEIGLESISEANV